MDTCGNNWKFTGPEAGQSGVLGPHLRSWGAGGPGDSSEGPWRAGGAPRWPGGSAPQALWAASRSSGEGCQPPASPQALITQEGLLTCARECYLGRC